MKMILAMMTAGMVILASSGLLAQTYTVTYSKKVVLAGSETNFTKLITLRAATPAASFSYTFPDKPGVDGKVLTTNTNGDLSWTDPSGGVSSLTNNASALLSLSASTGDIDLGLSSQSMNTFFAAPNGSAGEPSFRSILAADLPAPGGDVSGTYASMSVTKVNGSNWPSNTTGFLKNDGSGGLTWEAAGSGTVTSVGADAPLSSTGGNDPVISIPQATAGSDGYLSATDWSTFDAKQDALTTGNLSSSTTALVVTNGAGAVIGTGTSLSIADAAADGSTKGIASFAAADFNSTSGNISIDYTNGQAASGSTKGFLTSADWTTFNNKQNALTTGNLTSSDITVTGGTGAVIGSGTSLAIASGAVTYGKIQSVTDNRLLGRSAGSNGTVQEISIGSGLSLSGGTLSASGGSSTTIIKLKTADQTVTNAGATNDNTLSASLTTGVWLVRGMFVCSTNDNANDVLIDFTYSSTSDDFQIGFVNNGGKGASNNSNDGPSGGRWTALSSSKTFNIDASKEIGIAYEGYISVTGDGTLQVRFGNGTAAGGKTTTMHKGSTLVVTKQ